MHIFTILTIVYLSVSGGKSQMAVDDYWTDSPKACEQLAHVVGASEEKYKDGFYYYCSTFDPSQKRAYSYSDETQKKLDTIQKKRDGVGI